MKYTSALQVKLIYVFRIHDTAHKDCLKIGETTADNQNIWGLAPNSKELNEAAKNRINQYTQTAGIKYDLLYTELAVFEGKDADVSFSDTEVHKVLLRSGIEKKMFDTEKQANEWFITDLETVKNAIKAVKEGRNALKTGEITEKQSPIILRPEQKEAIEKTKKQFKKGNEMLWFAKMRFGKTLCALQVVKEMNFTRTLILTHRPVVDEGWFEDFGKIFYDAPNFDYGSKNRGNNFENLEKQVKKDTTNKTKYVYFASMQDLRGSAQVGGNFDKNNELFSTNWDFIIVDEAHEGTQTDLGKNVMREITKPNTNKNTKVLHLSGTPFNLLDNYKEEEIFMWDYVREQQAKADWDKVHFGDPNPYASLPRLNIFTYHLGKILNKFEDEEVAFNFREFFSVHQNGEFAHKKDVLAFLNLICKEDKDSNYPYATKEYRENFRHSLWMVPGVKEAKALSAMLQNHPTFGQFKIVNVAGDGDEEETNEEALQKVKKAITDKAHETYTITLSCGRLTTGVSVPAWTAVFMLSGSFNTSASGYMQTIFRVQTPATINGRMKEECFVFDFAPDRTLKIIAETAKITAKKSGTKGNTTGEDDRTAMQKFLNFCPVIAMSGSQMKTYDVNAMLEQLKKVYVERVVRNGFEDNYLYNNEQLMKLNEVELKDFEKLKGIIGSTKAMPKSGDIEINAQGFTNEEYEKAEQAAKKNRTKEELTEAEKKLLKEREEKRKNRENAISILRGISIRMPLLIYGADVKDEEKEINIDNFAELIDTQSWDEFMPKGVTKKMFRDFKKYYDPDVFRAAGKQIRTLARATDKLSIEERIARITAIFGTFRNPDKETVLTPWRVVNMHMGDCVGGYVFFDDKMEKILDKPRLVNRGEVTQQVFDENARILEINSKSGLYPLFMAYGIYKNIENKYFATQNKTPSIEEQHKIWDKVIAENIFVICKTPMAKSITKRTLAGFRDAKTNTKFFEKLVNQITDKQQNFLEKIKQGKTYWKANTNNTMKFNAIVGNPPYQEMDGGAGVSAKPVYNHFVEIAKAMKPNYISMIMPSRWFAGGKGLDEFREKMLNDSKISKIVDFTNAKDCFPNTSIGGGINYFLWDIKHDAECEFSYVHDGVKDTMKRKLNDFSIFIRYNKAITIIQKIDKHNEEKLSKIVSSRNPFGFSSNTRGKTQKFENCISLYSSEGKSYLPITEVDSNNIYLKSYKIMVSKVTSEHAGESDKNGMFRILSRTEIINPFEACTDSYLIIGNFNIVDEALALLKYLKSKFSRFLLLQAVTSINLSKDKFDFVPLQNFTSDSDIDWNKSIAEIDRQLYVKYGLSGEEIGFIESMIKAME
jgi:hypothetical protein